MTTVAMSGGVVPIVTRGFVPAREDVRAVETARTFRVLLLAAFTSPIRPFSYTETEILVRWRRLNQRQALPRYQ